MEPRRRNSSGAEGDAGGGALELARRTALLRRSGYRRAPTHSSHELRGVPESVTLFRLVRASSGEMVASYCRITDKLRPRPPSLSGIENGAPISSLLFCIADTQFVMAGKSKR